MTSMLIHFAAGVLAGLIPGLIATACTIAYINRKD